MKAKLTSLRSFLAMQRISGSKRKRRRDRLLRMEQLESRRLLTVELEPNETLATATLLPSTNDLLEGRVSGMDDRDCFRVALTQGQRLSIDTQNANAAMLSQTLPPAVEILDAAAHVVAVSADGRSPSYIAPADADYYVRVTSQHAFGTFADEYGMRTTITAYSGGTESEPNDATATADALTAGQHFRGSLSSLSDADFFSVSGSAGQMFYLDFSAPAALNPSVRLRRPDGTLLATDQSGQGLYQALPVSGTYTMELRADNAAGNVTGQYVGALGVVASSAADPESGNDFSAAVNWSLTPVDSYMVGGLSNLDDVDVFA
jgi:hypothetical protein